MLDWATCPVVERAPEPGHLGGTAHGQRLADDGPSRDNVQRDRYRVLWDVTIDGRLARSLRADQPGASRDARWREFAATFSMLGDAADTYAVVVKDLRTGRGVAINADRVFYAASVFKLFVMYEAFRQESLGLLQWTDQLVMTPYYDSFGFNVRGTALCDTLTVGRAARAMMTVSDNAAAVLLQDLVGSGNVNRSMEALGLVASEISEELPITAADVALLLEAIGRGRAVSMEASEEMIALMKGEALDNGLAKDLPDGVELAHKTGNWSNATHDAGIVFAPRGAYVIVVLSDTDHETALIREIARAVYERHEGSGR